MPTVPAPFSVRRRSFVASLVAAALLATGLIGIEGAGAPPATATGSFGSLPTGDGPTDIALASGFVYVADRNSGTVSVFDTTDWSIEPTLTVGNGPLHVSANNAGTEVWVSNFDDGTISIIDTETNVVTETLATGGLPRSVVFTADDAIGYVLNSGLDVVQAIDTATHAITPIGASLLGLPVEGVLSVDEQFLFLDGQAGLDRIYRLDLVAGTVDTNATIPLPDAGGAYLTTNRDRSELWLSNNGDVTDSVVVFNATATQILATIPLQGTPAGLGFSPDGDIAYVTEYTLDQVTLIDTSTYEIITRVDVGNEPYGLVATDSGLVAVPNFLDDTIEIIGLETERLAGASRVATAVEVSKRAFPTVANTVFLTSGDNFPDALAAGPAAGFLDGPLLLTNPTSLPTVVRNELIRLKPDLVYIIGGTAAVSTSVMNAVKTIQPNTVRISGSNRYATGEAVVEEVWDSLTVDEVFIATGRDYPDALSAGAVAAAAGVPVLLVDGAASRVPSSMLQLIDDLSPTTITLVGGTGVVSKAIMNQLKDRYGSGAVRRLAGDNRYETSTAISADAYASSESVILATGANFPDALAAASLAARADAPLYLVPRTCVTPGAREAVYGGQATYLFLLGGTSVLSSRVADLIEC